MSVVHLLLAVAVFLLSLHVAVPVGAWAAWTALVLSVLAIVVGFVDNDRRVGR